ncbi:unnamed protein product [Withania somnifera]
MGDDAFDGHQLGERLSKLNSSQQSIESLSRWCITYRKKAKQIVETWDKSFRSAQREQRVSFLYLANDILQNSRRKGSEFVNEFWKVLPASLKHVFETGDENGKKVASRLVDIWEERKVFGSRGQNLKDEVMGKSPALPVSNGKSSNPIKVVKKDAHSVRIKLAAGCTPEKIVTAFQLVHDENVNEADALNKCKEAVFCVGEMKSDIENLLSQGNLQGSELMDKMQEQENILQQCISHLENAESLRVTLISQLKDALQDQESKLGLLHSGLQLARGQIELAKNVRRGLTSHSIAVPPLNAGVRPIEVTRTTEPTLPSVPLTNIPLLLPTSNPATFANSKTNDEESKRAAAAAVAAKLAASTSSAQMLTSVLSSLVAEEAASLSSGLKSTCFSSSLPFASPEKRLKLDKPMAFSDMKSTEGGSSTYFTSSQQLITSIPLAQSSGLQSVSQSNQMQTPFLPPPPPPPLPPANSPASQLVQSSPMMMGMMPYGYSAGIQPPLSSQIAMGLRPPPPPQQAQQQQLQTQQPQSQQQPANSGFYRPPGIGFYGQAHQQTTPAAPRQ